MDAALWSALAAPGSITNIWGKSGAGKTSLALDLAISEIRDGRGRVLYVTDDPESVAALIAGHNPQVGATNPPGTRESDDFILIRSPTFKNLGEVVHQIPFAFLPDEATRGSEEFKKFVGSGENDLSENVIGSFKAYKAPSMVIVDEVTRQFKRRTIEAEDLGPLILQLVTQLGFLKKIAAERGIKVILTSANRTISGRTDGTEETRFVDVPIANDVLDHYVDIDAQMQWTPRAGERNIVITGPTEKNKQLYHVIDIEALHNRLAGGIHP